MVLMVILTRIINTVLKPFKNKITSNDRTQNHFQGLKLRFMAFSMNKKIVRR